MRKVGNVMRCDGILQVPSLGIEVHASVQRPWHVNDAQSSKGLSLDRLVLSTIMRRVTAHSIDTCQSSYYE